MNPAAIMMFRDEEDIIYETLKKWQAIGIQAFYLTDNCSTDNSMKEVERFRAEAGNITVSIMNSNILNYPGREVYNFMKDKAIHYGHDWIFPIDADEQPASTIPDFDLHKYLEELADASEFYFCSFSIPYRDNFCNGKSRWHEPQRKVFGRVPYAWTLSYGSHQFDTQFSEKRDDFFYEHYPVRSYEQFRKKAINYMTAMVGNPDLLYHPHALNHEKWKEQGESFIENLYESCLSTLQWPPL